jgi:hypothetical protein
MSKTAELTDAAHEELLRILDEIEREDGPSTRHNVVGALRSAVRDGRIYGASYDERDDSSAESEEDMVGCVIGQIAYARGSLYAGSPRVPGWDHSGEGGLSALERLVLQTNPGETPASSAALAALDGWLATC